MLIKLNLLKEAKIKRIIYLIPLLILIAGCMGGSYPFDNSGYENYEMQMEMEELRQDGEMYDEYLESKWDSYSETASAELQEFDEPDYDGYEYSDSTNGCPSGCKYHKDGCNIKGNISFNTDEKIYHLHWQEYYDETVINPDFGERWFCNESEAKQNGWRRSKQ